MEKYAEVESTKDAIANKQHNTTNMAWDMVHTGKKNEQKRRRVLMGIFDITSASRYSGVNNRPMFTML